MAFKVVNTTPMGGIPFEEEVLGKLGAEYTKVHCPTEDQLIATVSDADGVITAMEPFTRKVIKRLTKCKVISNIGIGYDNIDVDAATEYGICVSNVPDYCLEEMSDHAMALLLACARKIVRLDKGIREGKMTRLEGKEIRAPMYKLRGQTLGLVGFGRIPRILVGKAQGFGLRVIAYDPYVAPATVEGYGIEMVDKLDHLLEESDFVSVHAALTKETEHMFGLEQFKKMKPTAYFINTARGGLVDQEALHSAVTEGYIAGAGLDVMKPDLDIESPLLKLDNVIYTGHSGYYSETSIVEVRRRPVEEVARMLQGEWPRALVNPQVKERFTARWGKFPPK